MKEKVLIWKLLGTPNKFTNINRNSYQRLFLKFTQKKKKKKRLFLKDTKNVINPILGTYTYMLGSKTLGSKCIKTSMCNVGKQ